MERGRISPWSRPDPETCRTCNCEGTLLIYGKVVVIPIFGLVQLGGGFEFKGR